MLTCICEKKAQNVPSGFDVHHGTKTFTNNGSGNGKYA